MRFISDQQLYYILVYSAIFCVGCYKFIPSERPRLVATLLLAALSAAFWYGDSRLHMGWLWEASAAIAEIVLVQVFSLLIFNILLARLRLPLIIRDIAIGIAYSGIILILLTRLGANITGVVATSTVLTAVIGLSMQESLLNVVGGIVIQVEREISLGDFIKTESNGSGWVRTFRTRYTAIQTPELDTILIPNNILTKSSVTVYGKLHRRVIPFRVSYEHSPSMICETVQEALRATPLTGITSDPAPLCVVTQLHPDHVEYGAKVFQNRPGHSYAEISAVLTRVYYALARAGYPLLSVPKNVSVLQVNQYPHLRPDNISLRLAGLKNNEIFGALAEEELTWLAERFMRMQYAPGESVVRQGDSLYLVVKGSLKVLLEGAEGRSEHVADLSPGSIFGEMSLLTGDPRSASVVASEHVECDHLNKADFACVLQRRPELAEQISLILAERQSGLDEARRRLNSSGPDTRLDFLKRIQDFFRLSKRSA